MSATLNLHKVHRHSSHKRVARTNFYHEFSLVRVSLEFRGVSLLKIKRWSDINYLRSCKKLLLRWIFFKIHELTELKNSKNSDHIPSGKSCLLAKINIIASRISLSLIIRCSSWRASSILSLSAQSTTKISPWVPVEWKKKFIYEYPMKWHS